MLRLLPGMTVLAPADPMEVRACLRAAVAHPHPTYMRIGKKGEKDVHAAVPALSVGSSVVMREGNIVTLLVSGVLLPAALEAADLLEARGITTEVVSCPTIKPLDVNLLSRVFNGRHLVATIEEHSVLGGFGGSIAEWLTDQAGVKARLVRFGTPDEFLHETCEQEHAHEKFGLTAAAIATRIEATLGRS